jgi:hypothetical protein
MRVVEVETFEAVGVALTGMARLWKYVENWEERVS